MLKRFSILALAALVPALGLALPAAAQQESWSVGGGYWTLPNVSVEGVDSNGMYACVVMRSMSYMLELDYAIDDPGFLALAADYLYPLNQQGMYFGGTGYIGLGYTYFSADELDNESGFNAIVGAALGESLFGTIRYDFLGSDEELLTIGVSYSFY
jgi:hypothetical protein